MRKLLIASALALLGSWACCNVGVELERGRGAPAAAARPSPAHGDGAPFTLDDCDDCGLLGGSTAELAGFGLLFFGVTVLVMTGLYKIYEKRGGGG